MLKVCRQAGCYKKSKGTYCPGHTFANTKTEHRQVFDVYRADDPIRKLYRDRRWGKTRFVVLRRDPLCTSGEICGGAKASTVVDHDPLSAREIVAQFGEAEFFNPDRCRGKCKPCHDRKTAREDSWFAGSHKFSTAVPPLSARAADVLPAMATAGALK
jgi:5-methylcytosine-specific restriction protein A